MAEATTTRPRRSRAAASTTAAKPAPAKAAAKPAAKVEAPKNEVTRFTIELEHAGTTKSYEKFAVPDSYKGTVVGSVYAPLGTERVAVLIVGPGDAGEPGGAE